MPDYEPLTFIDEPIEPVFDAAPALEKKPCTTTAPRKAPITAKANGGWLKK